MTHGVRSDTVNGRHGWTVVVASFALMAVGGGSMFIVVVSLKPIAAEFDWPRAIPALGYSLIMLGTGVGGILMGYWSDRAGVARPALVGALSIAFGAWLAGRSGGYWQLLIAHGLFIGFLGNSTLFGPLVANATRWFDHRRGVAVAIVASGQTVAGAIWPPILRALVDHLGWRATFTVFAAVSISTMLPLLLLVKRPPPKFDPPQGPQQPSRTDRARVLDLPPLVVLALLCTAIVGCCVAMAMPIVHLLAHATDLGYLPARGAELLSVMLGVAVLSRLFWGFVADRIGGLRTLVLTSGGQALMLLCFVWVDHLAALYLIAALFGLAYGGIVPCYPLILREHFPISGTAWRLGTVLLFGTIGMALGGWLGARIFDLSGSYQAAFLLGAAFNLGNIAIVCALKLRETRLRPAAVTG